MSRFASIFKNHMDQKGVRYRDKGDDVISIIYDTDNAKSVEVLVGFDDDDKNLVTIVSFAIGEFPQDKFGEVLVTCNALNNEYRWMKFYVNDNNCITVSSDAILDEKTCGEECMEYVLRMIRIIDTVYPQFMKLRWG